MLLEVVFELSNLNAIDSGSAFVLDHPLIGELQVAAFAHRPHQPACLLQLRFRPQMVRRFCLGAHRRPLQILSGLFRLHPTLSVGFCLLWLHRDTTAYSRSLLFGPLARTGASYGLC